MAWYGTQGRTQDVSLRLQEHQFELSGQPMLRTALAGKMRDRLAVGFETHRIAKVTVGGDEFRIGGFQDVIAQVSYGIDHRLATQWWLAWRAAGRYGWVFVDSQRHLRLNARILFSPKPRHAVSLEGTFFYVHRNPDQAGNDLPRNSVQGQVALDYAWLSRVGVGVGVRTRYASSYLTGEAPVYELREESLNTSYADLTVGLRAVWR